VQQIVAAATFCVFFSSLQVLFFAFSSFFCWFAALGRWPFTVFIEGTATKIM